MNLVKRAVASSRDPLLDPQANSSRRLPLSDGGLALLSLGGAKGCAARGLLLPILGLLRLTSAIAAAAWAGGDPNSTTVSLSSLIPPEPDPVRTISSPAFAGRVGDVSKTGLYRSLSLVESSSPL
ncbi:hypothetical protein NUW58_g7765 [Xylaria curta]|uniref:Uncharacterized protein n=1 Tax=Xylaria curta TaxID=42375 RepID=A0ACC1NF84_9PEZI|nr:hypothetical protein NUW58_g7765 [Xylaria curta]